jgi:hypothetical protein
MLCSVWLLGFATSCPVRIRWTPKLRTYVLGQNVQDLGVRKAKLKGYSKVFPGASALLLFTEEHVDQVPSPWSALSAHWRRRRDPAVNSKVADEVSSARDTTASNKS